MADASDRQKGESREDKRNKDGDDSGDGGYDEDVYFDNDDKI